jgi:Trk K+ transport system NAD-binding subunit
MDGELPSRRDHPAQHAVAVATGGHRFQPESTAASSPAASIAIWGDISQRDTLEHAGIRDAKLVVSTLPNTVLRGTSNLRLVQLVRSLNRKPSSWRRRAAQ